MIPPGVPVVTPGTIHENKSFSGAWSVESLRAPGGWSAIVRKMWIGIRESGKRRNINVNATGLEGPRMRRTPPAEAGMVEEEV